MNATLWTLISSNPNKLLEGERSLSVLSTKPQRERAMKMALRWLVHSACHVLGNPKEADMTSNHVMGKNPTEHAMNGGFKDPGEVRNPSGFQMPLHYPRYTKDDYQKMEEWKVDMLLREYGIVSFKGNLEEKRKFAMGAFLWPDQY